MVEDEKIKYSDIIEPDDSIEKLISQIEQLNSSYGTMLNAVRASADRIVHALKKASGATSEGRERIDEATMAASRLETAERNLRFALSETGREVARLKDKTADVNRVTVEQAREARALAGSYDKLKAQLNSSIMLWKALSDEERDNAEMGGKVLTEIISLKEQLTGLNAKLKPVTASLSEQEKVFKTYHSALAKAVSLQGEEGQALRGTLAATAALDAEYKQQINTLTQQARLLEKKKHLSSAEHKQLIELNSEIKRETQLRNLKILIEKEEEGSYNRLSLQYQKNKIELNAMGTQTRTTTEYGKKLEEETLRLYKQMILLQEATGNHKLSVGNYAKAWDGLGFSISQVIRELPSAAMGLRTLFIAVSNNVPIVFDEIARLKERNKAAVANGEEAVNIMGEIGKSLFSWHTVLVLVLTTLSMYGEEIVNWISNLSKGRKAVISLKEALKNVAKELEDNNNNYGDSIVNLKKLQQEWKSLKTTAEKNQWIRDNKSGFDKLGVAVNSVTEADNIFINNTTAVVEALKLRAKAAAAQTLASEKYKAALIKRNEAETEHQIDSSLGFFTDKGDYQTFPTYDFRRARRMEKERMLNLTKGLGGVGALGASTLPFTAFEEEDYRVNKIKELVSEAKNIEATADAYFDLAAGYEASAKAELKAAGIDSPHKKGPNGRTKEIIDLDKRINEDRLKIQKKYEQSVTRLIDDELEQRKAKAADSREAESRELALQETYLAKLLKANESAKNGVFELDNKRYKQLTDSQIAIVKEQQKLIRETILKNSEFIAKENERFAIEQQQQELAKQQETIKLRLEAAKKGSDEEINLRLQALQTEYQQALVSNRLLPKGQQQSEDLIDKSFIAKMLQLLGEMDLEAFDASQKVQQESFNAMEHTEREKTRFMLEQERDRWNYLITLAEQGSLTWGNEQIAAARATVEGINNELGKRPGAKGVIGDIAEHGLAGPILSSLGFDDEGIQAFNEATDTIISNLQSIMEAEVQLAEAAVEAAQERADSAKSALEAEIEARNKGYANNVATARKEYEQEKKRVADNQKLLAQAQRRQEALDTAMQTSSLITASANIWKSMSGFGIIGPALAIAAIAGMWASFAAAKVKARQVTAAEQEYGEGGLEFLEGGSHASGNDISLGTKNAKGKNMRAEGGEALAIINKRNTRRYRKQLPGIIEALNKGTFEDKYLRAFETGENVMLSIGASQNSVDLSKLEHYTEKISKQGEVQRIGLSDGSVLIVNKNVRRVIRNY